MRAKLRYRPLALVLTHGAEQRDRDCLLLSEKGYDVLGFADAESAVAWLEEETPAVAIVEQVADLRQQAVLKTLAGRGVLLRSADK